MAESKRNPAIGKAWLAHHAFGGDEDLEFVREYVSHAKSLVGDLSAKKRPLDGRETEEELAGLFLFLIELEMAMAENGSSEFKVEIKRRKPGKPINKTDRAHAGHKAAAMVEKSIAAGTKQEAAIADAVGHTGLSRSEIFRWLRHRRRFLDPERERKAETETATLRAGLPPLSG